MPLLHPSPFFSSPSLSPTQPPNPSHSSLSLQPSHTYICVAPCRRPRRRCWQCRQPPHTPQQCRVWWRRREDGGRNLVATASDLDHQREWGRRCGTSWGLGDEAGKRSVEVGAFEENLLILTIEFLLLLERIFWYCLCKYCYYFNYYFFCCRVFFVTTFLYEEYEQYMITYKPLPPLTIVRSRQGSNKPMPRNTTQHIKTNVPKNQHAYE